MSNSLGQLEICYESAKRGLFALSDYLHRHPNLPCALLAPLDLTVVIFLISTASLNNDPSTPHDSPMHPNCSSPINSDSTLACDSVPNSMLLQWAIESASYSCWDYLVLASLRFVVLIIHSQTSFLTPQTITKAHARGSRLWRKRRLEKVNWLEYLPCAAWLANYTYTLVRLAIVSEEPATIERVSTWLLASWNLFAATLIWIVWAFYPRITNPTRPTMVELNAAPAKKERKSGSESSDNSSSDEDEIKVEEQLGVPAQIKMMLDYCMPHWKVSLISTGFLLVTSWVTLQYPIYHGQVISAMVEQRDPYIFAYAAAMMVLVSLSSGLLSNVERRFFPNPSAQIGLRMKKDFYKAAMSQEMAYFDRIKASTLYFRLGWDCNEVASAFSDNVNHLFEYGSMLVGSLFAMLAISWRLTLLPLVLIPLTSFTTHLNQLWQEKHSSLRRKARADPDKAAWEALSNMRTVRTFGCEAFESQRYAAKLDKSHEKQTELRCWASYLAEWMWKLTENLMLFSTLIYGGYLAHTSRLEATTIITFLLFQDRLRSSFKKLHHHYSTLKETLDTTHHVFYGLRRQPQVKMDGRVVKPNAELYGHIVFSHVSFTYASRTETQVIRDVSFEVRPGETVALVGKSGAGKSTIISLLERFYEPSTGEITLDGVHLSDYNHQFYHQRVALVPQEPVLYSCSIRDNILYGYEPLPGESPTDLEVRMVSAAKQANIHDFIVTLPNGYDTRCGDKGSQLSGGQKQRVAIARALVREPKVLLLDEATSAMDSETEYHIREAIQKCSVGRTVLVIAHRLSTVENADRIVVLKDGRIAEMGTHCELLTQENGLYAQMVRQQHLFIAKPTDADKQDGTDSNL